MRLYYTNISTNEGVQTRPDLSLGGFKSSTLVPNNSFSNLFSDISCYSVSEDQNEYIAIALVNEEAITVTDVTLYFDYPDGVQKNIEMAFVNFNASGEMEVISNPYSTPYNAEFSPADGVVNAINIGDLVAGAKIGVWFKKIILKSVIEDLYSNTSLDENGNPEEINEDIPLVITWT
jgi:hypothetical protein